MTWKEFFKIAAILSVWILLVLSLWIFCGCTEEYSPKFRDTQYVVYDDVNLSKNSVLTTLNLISENNLDVKIRGHLVDDRYFVNIAGLYPDVKALMDTMVRLCLIRGWNERYLLVLPVIPTIQDPDYEYSYGDPIIYTCQINFIHYELVSSLALEHYIRQVDVLGINGKIVVVQGRVTMQFRGAFYNIQRFIDMIYDFGYTNSKYAKEYSELDPQYFEAWE